MIALQISHTVQTSTEHCSIASHCLALSYWCCGWRFIIGTFPKWPISIVMDAWFYCAKRALSHSSKLLSQAVWWAVLILSPLASSPFPCIPQMETTVSLILRRTHFTRNKCILLFTDFVIYALCGFCHSFRFICLCLCASLSAPAQMRGYQWVYKHMHMCMSSCGVQAERKSTTAHSLLDAVSTLSFCALDAISSYLETQLSIISIIAGKLQSAFDLLLIFFLLVTLKWADIQKSRNYRKMCVCVAVPGFVVMKVTRKASTFNAKFEQSIFSTLLDDNLISPPPFFFLKITCKFQCLLNSNSLYLCMLTIPTQQHGWVGKQRDTWLGNA